jgi:hypothetical protein
VSGDRFDWTEECFAPADIFEKPDALEGLRVLEVVHGHHAYWPGVTRRRASA